MRYRVVAARWDIPKHQVGSFDSPTDEEAKKRFVKEFECNPQYSWDWLRLERINQIEKTTIVATAHVPKD